MNWRYYYKFLNFVDEIYKSFLYKIYTYILTIRILQTYNNMNAFIRTKSFFFFCLITFSNKYFRSFHINVFHTTSITECTKRRDYSERSFRIRRKYVGNKLQNSFLRKYYLPWTCNQMTLIESRKFLLGLSIKLKFAH